MHHAMDSWHPPDGDDEEVDEEVGPVGEEVGKVHAVVVPQTHSRVTVDEEPRVMPVIQPGIIKQPGGVLMLQKTSQMLHFIDKLTL